MDSIITALEPHLLELLGLILTILIGLLSRQLYAWTGLEIEKKHREVLHEALMSGAMSAINHGPGTAIETLKAHAITHARRSAPEAMKALIPGDTVIDTIAERYVRDAQRRLDRHAVTQ